ncbi:MAG: universal stress protein [Acidobacteriia bacterium]|nr:universal stress protein [Terriglobia bacterium]
MKALESTTSISFKNILFLTDFTKETQGAMSFALALARHYDAHIFPAHAVSPFLPTELEAPIAPEIIQQVEADKKKALTDLVKNTGVPYEVLTTTADIEAAVPRWIDEHGIDLIVMGTHGRRGIQRLLLGSTAEAVFRTASCPVLTVGPSVLPQPSSAIKIKRILFATDLSKPTEYAATYALSLAQEYQARTTFLNVLPVANRTHAQLMSEGAIARNQLRELVPPEITDKCEVEFLVTEGNPAERILGLAEEKSVDLIVLGLPKDKRFSTHFRSGVTYEVVSSATAAVLTMRSLW